jgi:hypothetical protein
MSNTGRIPLAYRFSRWFSSTTMLSLFIYGSYRFRIIIIIINLISIKVTLMDIKLKNRWTLNNIT